MASLKEFLGSTGLGALWARITEELNKKATSADLADVATSGSYNDLEDKPFIPSAISDLTDDSGHYTKPANGIPASDLEETYLTSFTETDPTVPSWAKEADKPTYTAQEIGALPADTVIPTVPTNVSAFTNDAGYLTQHQDISGKADKSEIPTSVSELTNDAGYITGYTETDPTVPAWAKASTKPSYTAAEIGAPTVAEMNSAIGDAIGNVHQFEVEIVQELPVANIKEHTIYFVPKQGATNDVYDEYIYTNNAWEMIGNTQIDLSNYATKGEIPSVPVQDIQINETSIVGIDGAAIIPFGNQEHHGVVKGNAAGGVIIDSQTGEIMLSPATTSAIKHGNGAFKSIVASKQHEAVFYGMAKAAGDTTQAQSDNVVGTYTDAAKTAIRTMLGVATPADIPTNISAFTNDVGYLTQHQDISGKANVADLATVATSGSYEDLSNKPTIPEVPVQDVQVNGTSILDNSIANIPYASTANNKWGLMKIGGGLYGDSSGVMVDCALPEGIKSGTGYYCPIVPKFQEYSVFYGLSKAAGIDLASATVTFGTYPDTSKAAIQNLLGITSLFSAEESPTATAAHTVNSLFMMDGKLHRATSAIAIGDAVTAGSNCEVVKADEVFVKNMDYADANNYGLVKVGGNGITINNTSHIIQIDSANSNQIKAQTSGYAPITPLKQHEAVYYGLSKLAGVDLANETVTVGKYPAASLTAIQTMLGITRIVANQEIQYQSATYRHPKGQTFLMNGLLFKALRDIEIGDIVLPEDNCNATNLNYAIFAPKETSILVRPSYLLNKIQDPTISAQVNTLRANHLAFLPADQIIIEKTTDGGVTWEDAEISDARKVMLFSEVRQAGILLPRINGEKNTLCGLRVTFTAMKYNVPENTPETQKYNYWNSSYVLDKERYNTLREFYFWLSSDADTMTIKAERAKGNAANNWETIFENNKARFTGWAGNDYISFTEAEFGGGVTQTSQPWNYRLTFMTAYKTNFNEFNQTHITSPQSLYEIRGYGASCWTQGNNYAGTDHLYSFDRDQNATFPRSVNAYSFNGKVNGHDINKDVPANAVFTDTTYDIQINETSIINNGVANIPIASPTTFGVVKTDANSFGIKINESGRLYTDTPGLNEIKTGTQAYKPIVPATQHSATFYGLAKAAGDTTMSSSSNGVGTYTTEAKAAIHAMLGIDPASIAAQVDIPLIETVSGTTPTITGQPNVRYICGEVSTITITPPASGSMNVRFESGSTAATMTVPSTVKWPAWFDAEALEANTIYEILITDGIYGGVMTWAT